MGAPPPHNFFSLSGALLVPILEPCELICTVAVLWVISSLTSSANGLFHMRVENLVQLVSTFDRKEISRRTFQHAHPLGDRVENLVQLVSIFDRKEISRRIFQHTHPRGDHAREV